MCMTELALFRECYALSVMRRLSMDNEKSPEELRKEKEQLKVQDQKTENVFEDKSRVPNEQNAWRETQYKRGQ